MQAKMLENKVAIVSGASYGMGFSMAELFAREGAKVVMTARGQEKLDAAVKQIREIRNVLYCAKSRKKRSI
jgi:NADP-dependent 3-hydroxy acid dehydrogenase YdfG